MPYKIKAKCPNCGKDSTTKDDLEKLFGWRKVGGKKTIPQSYCRECRAKKKIK